MSGVPYLGLWLDGQREWSVKTIGPGDRKLGICDHIEKEWLEYSSSGKTDVGELIDVAILAFDGAWRQGQRNEQILQMFQSMIYGVRDMVPVSAYLQVIREDKACAWIAFVRIAAVAYATAVRFHELDYERWLDHMGAKLRRNQERNWPPVGQDPNKAIEHVRDADEEERKRKELDG